MNYRHYITVSGSRTEVTPLGWRECSLVDSKDNEIFYRRRLEGSLVFVGADYTYLLTLEVNSPCLDITYEVEKKEGGIYRLYWRGHFSTSDGEIDLDRCTFTVTPKPLDSYSVIDLYGDEQYNILSAGLTLRTVNTYDVVFTRNYYLRDVIQYLLRRFAPSANIVSWFLDNDINPIIGGENQYKYLTIAQKSDIKRPTAANPATIGMMSFNEAMEILRMYNLYYTFDGTTLRIEHYDFWQGSEGMDLRTQTKRNNKYSYDKSDMPKYEKFAFMEAKDGAYVEHTISYDSPCVDEKLTTEYRTRVTTDLSYIINSMGKEEISDISDDGWVIIANYVDSGLWAYRGVAWSSPLSTYNFVNSWAYLLRAFFFHGRVLMKGKIQGTTYDFISSRKIRLQETPAIICDEFAPEDYITTELGEWLKQKGYVKQATLHPDGKAELQLMYGEDKNEEVKMPTRVKSIQCFVDSSEVTTILSEEPLTDLYYWIWFNDDNDASACMEIMIPAGTMRQVDAITYGNPVTSQKFIISSLTGWTFIYDDNLPYTTSPDCGTGTPPEPPPGTPPDPTTMIGAGQATNCAPVRVTWSPSLGATYYKLYRRETGWVFVDNVHGTMYDDYWAGLQDGVEFFYRVQACNADGCSADSNEVNVIAQC